MSTERAEKIKKRLISGVATKYDEAKHIPLLYDIFEKGEEIAAFCAEALICKKTFYNWLDDNPNFRNAYKIVLNIAERKWQAYALSNKKNFNYGHWLINMKHRFKFTFEQSKGLTGKETPSELVEKTIELLAKGKISDRRADKLLSLASTKIKALEFDNMERRLAVLEQRLGVATSSEPVAVSKEKSS